MVLHIKYVPEHGEGNLGLRESSMKLLEGMIVRCTPKVSQCLTFVRNLKAYEYISIDNMYETF